MATEADATTAESRAAQAPPVPPAEHTVSSPTETDAETPAPQPTEAPTARGHERAIQKQFIEGESKDLEISLDKQTQDKVVETLLSRRQATETLSGKERPLTTIDKWVLKLGPEAIARLEAGNLTKEDLALSWYVLHDEILQKELAVGQLVKDNKIIDVTKVGRIPFLRRIVENPRLQTQLEASAQRLSSEYTREIGFETWDPERIVRHLTELNQTRLNIEQSLFRHGLNDPLFDEVSTPIAPLEFGRKTGNLLHDAVVDELMGAEGILTQRFGGKTYLELWQEDPIAAHQALYEANQRALTQFAKDQGESFLKGEAPKANIQLIEGQAKKLEEKPTPEDIGRLQTTATNASTEFTEAEKKLNDLNKPVEDARRILAEKQLAFNKTSNTFNRTSERFNPEIERLQELTGLLYNSTQLPDTPLSPEQRVSMQQAIAATTQSIARNEEIIRSRHDRLDQLSQQEGEAETELNAQKENVERLQKETEEKGLEEARGDFNQKRKAKENAERELKEKQEGMEKEITPEAKEQAKALRKYKEVAGGYGKIIDARYSQAHAEEFTRERLADTKERPDGQIEGAERIREHIFRIINPIDYDPVLARKMLSDETIARAIIWMYKIDPETTSTKGTTLNQLLSDLKTTKDMIGENPEDKDLLKEKSDQEKEIIKLALPNLRSSQFKAGDLLRFMVHEGLKSAERGNPYLELSEYYQTPAPELRLRAESIYSEGIGTAEIDPEDNTVTWAGTVPNSTMPGLSRNDLPTSYRITQQISPLNDIYSAEVITDQRFLQSLPENIHGPTFLPEAIKNAFYDQDGNLRADRQSPGSLTMFSQGSHENPDDTLNELNTIISPEASRIIAASVADNVLRKTPQERLEILRGLNANIHVPDFWSTVDTPLINDTYVGIPTEHTYTIDFDNNGNFFIADKSGNRQQLEAFYQRKLEGFINKLGVQALNPKQREALKKYYLTIQQTLGQEILKSLQRR